MHEEITLLLCVKNLCERKGRLIVIIIYVDN